MLTACAPLEQRPPAEPRVEYRDVPVDRPVPCFTEAERPVEPLPTPIDLEHATTDQKAAALAADNANDALYMAAVERLFIVCMQRQGKDVK